MDEQWCGEIEMNNSYCANDQPWRRFCNVSRRKEGVEILVILGRTMDRFEYGQILEENLLSSLQRLGLRTNFIFMHDNDPRYTSALVKDWLRNSSIQEMQWPSASPGLNSIEYLWDVLEDCVKKHHSKNKTKLTLHLMEEWSKIELSMLEKLVDSVPSRLNEYTYRLVEKF